MQVNMLEAKTQLSKLVEAALRGEDVVIANRGKPVVRLVRAESPTQRRAGAWEGLMTEAELDHAFSPEVESAMAIAWLDNTARPLESGLKPKRLSASPGPGAKATRRRPPAARGVR